MLDEPDDLCDCGHIRAVHDLSGKVDNICLHPGCRFHLEKQRSQAFIMDIPIDADVPFA